MSVDPGFRTGPCRLWRPAFGGWHLFALVAAGCGSEPTANVRGRVTVGGQPLAGGQVAFEANGRLLASPIGPDGRYELRNGGTIQVPPGDYIVLLAPPPPELVENPKTTEIRPAAPVDQLRYPQRYRNPETSGIRQTIPPGNSEIDLEFPPK